MMKIRKTEKLQLRYKRKFAIFSILNFSQNMPLPILHIFNAPNYVYIQKSFSARPLFIALPQSYDIFYLIRSRFDHVGNIFLNGIFM